jgi:hypothetical protein
MFGTELHHCVDCIARSRTFNVMDDQRSMARQADTPVTVQDLVSDHLECVNDAVEDAVNSPPAYQTETDS